MLALASEGRQGAEAAFGSAGTTIPLSPDKNNFPRAVGVIRAGSQPLTFV